MNAKGRLLALDEQGAVLVQLDLNLPFRSGFVNDKRGDIQAVQSGCFTNFLWELCARETEVEVCG